MAALQSLLHQMVLCFFGIWFAFWDAIICYVDENIRKLLNRILCTAGCHLGNTGETRLQVGRSSAVVVDGSIRHNCQFEVDTLCDSQPVKILFTDQWWV